jgi:sigma-B regulation protein RsbU (phosphoserine phosphatase)
MKRNKLRFSLGKKLALTIVVMSLVMGAMTVWAGYRTLGKYAIDEYSRIATNLARTLASQIDPNDLDRYYETQKPDKKYDEIQEFISSLAENSDAKYLYIGRFDEKGLTYLFDSDTEATSGGTYAEGGHCALGSYTELFGTEAEHSKQLAAGEEVAPITQRDDVYGWLMTAYAPIRRSDGTTAGYAMADIDMNAVMKVQTDFLATLFIFLAEITAVFLVVCLLILQKKMLRPIDSLTDAANRFIGNNKDQLESDVSQVNVPDIRTGDEVEQLADAFRKMETDMQEYTRSLVRMTAEKERIGAELSVATQIQADMLPRIFPAFPERKEIDIFATMAPAKEVGGDFYDFFLVDDDHLAAVIADVSGKGVPAALFMVIAKTLIKNHAQNRETPAEIFTRVNEQLCEGNDAGLFVTAWMGLLELSTGNFVYVNAGHNPPLLKRRGGGFEYLKCPPGFVLAGLENVKYRENLLRFQPGDRLFLYTDGVTEATDSSLRLYGEDRLKAELDRLSDRPVRQLLTGIKESIDAFAGEAEQFDDITMLGLEYKGGGGDA